MLPGGEYGHGQTAASALEPRFSEPEGFSRPINAAQSYLFFEAMRITLLDDLVTRQLPKMPLVLQMHDVYPEDWSRLITDLTLAWTGRLPTAPSPNGAAVHRATLSADLIDLWNNRFFSPRSVEMVLYRGRERRSGPAHLLGVKDIILPEGGSDDSDDDSGSDDDSDSEDDDNDDDPRFAGRKQGAYGVPGGYFANPEEERRARKREKKKEKKRMRKERRKRRKEAGRAWAIYLMYRPASGAGAGAGAGGAAVPTVHHASTHGHGQGQGHGHGHERTSSQTYGSQAFAGRKSPQPPSSGYAMAGGHSPGAQAAPFIPPSPRPSSAVAPLPYGQPQQGGNTYGQQPATYGSGGGGQPYGSQPYGSSQAQGSQSYGSQSYGPGPQGSQPYGASQGQGQTYAPGQAPATYTPVGTPASMTGYATYGGYGKGY